MFCGKRRREQETFETSAFVVDQHMDDVNISAKRTCDGVSSMPALSNSTNGMPYYGVSPNSQLLANGNSGSTDTALGASFQQPTNNNRAMPTAPMESRRPTSCWCSHCTGNYTVGSVDVVPDGILTNFNNNCNVVQSMEVSQDVDMQIESSPQPVQLTPVKTRSCARCVAGEAGHITHILE
ncbi:uncharacterized protein [Ptychodera flava]|uniref:uncharacterized protein n=1 Tax=Ptychodera flava TaxID=63121 RepID=UPI00396A1E21